MAVTDIRETHLTEIYQLVRAYSQTHSRKIKGALELDLDDFVQMVVTDIFRRQGLNHYDPDKCRSFEALIFRMCKNKVVDLIRAKFGTKTRTDQFGRPYKWSSLDAPIMDDEGDEFTLLDKVAADEGTAMVKMEMMEMIPDEQISPNYVLSWRQLFDFSCEISPKEIAKRIGISESRISQLQVEMGRRYIPAARIS